MPPRTTITPPVTEARTGTWAIMPDFDNQTGDCWGTCLPGFTYSGTHTKTVAAEPFVVFDGESLPRALLDFPLGMETEPDYLWQPGGDVMVGAAYGSVSLDVAFAALGLTASRASADVPPEGMPDQGLTGMTRLALLSCEGASVVFTGNVTGLTPTGYNPAVLYGSGRLSGTYVAFSWWWRVLGTDACGNTFEGPLFQTGVDPGPPWVRLDPDDEAAHPTPVVLNVSPNHGLLLAGTPVEIVGSGFGVGCAVTFGGVAATSVVAVTETRITCLAPAHAAGLVDVVVTNTDGVSS